MEDVFIVNGLEGEKARAFQATLLTVIRADGLWEGPGGNSLRPVLMSVAATHDAMRIFTANLKLGRKVQFEGSSPSWLPWRMGDSLEVLKSHNFRYTTQRIGDASVCTLFHPELFQIDPGMVDPEKDITFIVLPPSSWATSDQEVRNLVAYMVVTDQAEGIPEETLTQCAKLAKLFVVYLDRRTRCPILADPRFAMQLLVSALQHGLATFTTEMTYSSYGRSRSPFGQTEHLRYTEVRPEAAGYQPGLAFKASHADLEALLAKQVKTYLENTFY